MSSDTPRDEVAGGIRSLRKMRGSVPITAEMFTSTSNPLVIAFQVTVMFAAEHDLELSWTVLQQRWAASRRTAAEARRALIDLGYWAEVRARQSDGRFRTETRVWEARMTSDDLAGLAAEYAVSSVIHCGGRTYTVTPGGLAESDRATFSRRRVASSGNSVRPAETSVTTVTDIPESVTRSDQAIVDNPVTDIPESVTRSDQAKQEGSAGRTDIPESVTLHASISFGDGNTCMHDDFWAIMGRLVPTPIDRGGRNSRHDQLDVAFKAGWSPETLARWTAQQVNAAKRLSNPAGFVIATLREIPPPAEVPLSRREVDDQRAAEAKALAAQRAKARAACDLCDSDGQVDGRWCDHDPNSARRAAESAAKARQILAEGLAARRAGRSGSGETDRAERPREDGQAVG